MRTKRIKQVITTSIISLFIILATIIFLKYQDLRTTDNLNILLTIALVSITAVEALTTLSKYQIGNKQKRVDNLQNELEKFYGPVYSILHDVTYTKNKKGEEIGVLLPEEKSRLDEKFSTYPHIVNKELYEHWSREIRSLKIDVSASFNNNIALLKDDAMFKKNMKFMDPAFEIPKAFILAFIQEYERKVEAYRTL